VHEILKEIDACAVGVKLNGTKAIRLMVKIIKNMFFTMLLDIFLMLFLIKSFISFLKFFITNINMLLILWFVLKAFGFIIIIGIITINHVIDL